MKGVKKGFVRFQGIGLIERVDRLVQYDVSSQQTFPNYGFDFAVFSLFDSGDEFDWEWINARRDPSISDEQCLKFAPASWKTWVEEGHDAVPKCRRRVSKSLVVKANEQKPHANSREAKVLEQIYDFYQQKHRFEALAEWVAERILRSNGNYHRGWITPGSGDGGADFIARLDLGSGLACAKIVVLGQAKCESPNTPTSGRDIARTVARLRRGWIGVYVTTSYFSDRVQQEVIDDKYPILLVNGMRLAIEVEAARLESGFSEVTPFLQNIDKGYEGRLANRDPEEILIGLPPADSEAFQPLTLAA